MGFSLFGCATESLPPIPLVRSIELERYMGDWYVIAAIPTFIEKNSFDAVESYKLDPDGTIATTFTFREGGFDGKLKRYNPRGFVVENTNNALWGMQFIWPIKGEFRIAYVDPEYRRTIVARNARDYVWLMARTPQIPEDDYRELVAAITEMGYNPELIRKVPQSAR